MAVYLKGCLKEAMKFQNASRLVPRTGQLAKKFLRYYYSVYLVSSVHTIYNLGSFLTTKANSFVVIVLTSLIIIIIIIIIRGDLFENHCVIIA